MAFLFLVLAWGFRPLLLAGPAAAQEGTKDKNLVHWAFANQLGSGVYRIGEDNRLYVIRVNPRFSLDLTPGRQNPDRHVLLEFGFPVSFGIHRFDSSEGNLRGLPNRLHQYGLAVSSGLELPFSRMWRVRAAGHLGRGALLGEFKETAWIYGGDLLSRLQFEFGKSALFVINNLGWYAHSSNKDVAEDLTLLMNALETHFPLGRLAFKKQPLYLKLHLANFSFLKGIGYFFHPAKEPVRIRPKWELGFAVGAKKPIRLAFLRFDRVGLAVSFSDDHWGVRFYSNSLFYR